jgi:hypothetical protein
MKFLEQHNATILEGNNSPLARAVVPIEISPVADWYFQEAEVYETSLRDQFPSVVAPFPVTYLEYKIPRTWKIRNPRTGSWEIVSTPHGSNEYFACLIVQEALPDNFVGHDPFEGQVLNQILGSLTGPAIPKFKQFTFFFAGNDQRCTPACWAENYVDENGRMMGGPVHVVHHTLTARSSDAEGEAYWGILRAYGYPVYFALSLLVCKNVALKERSISAKDRKDAASVKSIPFSYRDMTVAPLLKMITEGELGNGNFVVTALRTAASHLSICMSERSWWSDYVKIAPGTEKAVRELATYRLDKRNVKKKEFFPSVVCGSCAVAAGGKLRTGSGTTWHIGECEVCGFSKPVTQPRDFGHPKFFKAD